MKYSLKQQRFMKVFIREIRCLLTEDGETKNNVDAVLNSATNAVNLASATISIAGIVAAPPSFGASLGAAGTAIAGLQAINCAYRYLHQTVTFSPNDPLLWDTFRLALEIFFDEVGCLICIQYSHFIEEKATESGINALARYAALRLTQAWLLLKADNKIITLEALLEKFIDIRIKATHSIDIEEFYLDNKENYYAEGVFSRARSADFDVQRQEWSFYASSQENRYMGVNYHGQKNSSTLEKYGYATFHNQASLGAYNNHFASQLRKLTNVAHTHQNYLWIYHSISTQEVIDYLSNVNTYDGLNDYLSQRYGTNIIAECHVDTLKGLDLRGGNFSEVNFRRANLQGCQLAGTRWEKAHLEFAKFGNITSNKLSLNGISFKHVFADGSLWQNINFTGADFSEASMRGTFLKNCITISPARRSSWDFSDSENTVTAESYLQKTIRQGQRQSQHTSNRVNQHHRQIATLAAQAQATQQAAKNLINNQFLTINNQIQALSHIGPIVKKSVASWYDYKHLDKDRDDLIDQLNDDAPTATYKTEERDKAENTYHIIAISLIRGYFYKGLTPQQRYNHCKTLTTTLLQDPNVVTAVTNAINNDFNAGNNPQAQANLWHQWHLINFLSVMLLDIKFITARSLGGRLMNGTQNGLAYIGSFFTSPTLDKRRYYYSVKVPVLEKGEKAKHAVISTIASRISEKINTASYRNQSP